MLGWTVQPHPADQQMYSIETNYVIQIILHSFGNRTRYRKCKQIPSELFLGIPHRACTSTCKRSTAALPRDDPVPPAKAPGAVGAPGAEGALVQPPVREDERAVAVRPAVLHCTHLGVSAGFGKCYRCLERGNPKHTSTFQGSVRGRGRGQRARRRPCA